MLDGTPANVKLTMMRKVIRLTFSLAILWFVCVVLFVISCFPNCFGNYTHRLKYMASPDRKIPSNVTARQHDSANTGGKWLGGYKKKFVNQDYINLTKFEIQHYNTEDYVIETKGKVLVLNKTLLTAGDREQEPIQKQNTENLAQVLRMRREDNERRYYTLRKTKVNPIDAEFIISGAQICSSDSKYMTILIIVPSIPSHNFIRDVIRSTYGSFAKKHFLIEYTAVEVTVKLMFLVGQDGTAASVSQVKNESREYGDIVYADFKESYGNLTRKMLIALKWVSVYCSDVDFVMKVDEDVFVNIPQLARELHQRPYGIKGSVYGYINVHSTVRRLGKWGVSKDEFPLTHYPNYATGNSYVISGNIIPRMFMISEYLPYMPIEDAFITGCLARIVEANIVSVPGFTFWHDSVPEPCKFFRDRRISATKVTMGIMFKLWKVYKNFEKYCNTF